MIDFEDLPRYVAIDGLYDGVTFSAQPGSCNGLTVEVRIVDPSEGTISPFQAAGVDSGCPDLSPDYLRMVFDDPQRLVIFMLGEYDSDVSGGTFHVRAYSTVDGEEGLLSTQTVISGVGVRTAVRIGWEGGAINIRRVEVEAENDAFEAIDDLSFGFDDTAPIALIEQPAFRACACDAVTVRGIACEDDGFYGRDWLEYRPVDDPEAPWQPALPERSTSGMFPPRPSPPVIITSG